MRQNAAVNLWLLSAIILGEYRSNFNSLFSKLRGGQFGATTEAERLAEAVLTLPLLVGASDGDISDVEKHQIMQMWGLNPTFLGLGGDVTAEIGWRILDGLRRHGYDVMIDRAAANLTPSAAETAMCFAIRTALADGTIEQSEHDILLTMAQRIGLTAERYTHIFEVMIMLQRPLI